MPVYWNKQFILIIKEVIHNVIKNSNNDEVEVNLKIDEDFNLFIEVKDYEENFPLDYIDFRPMLKTLKSRANAINLVMKINSHESIGTKVTIKGVIPDIRELGVV